MSEILSEPQMSHATIEDPHQRRAILISVCVALMAVIASVSGLNVAQPELAVEFDASQTEILWFINVYTITLSALLLPLGAIGDQWGRRRMLLFGLAVFGGASALAGLATSSEMMLVARFLSGVGAAISCRSRWRSSRRPSQTRNARKRSVFGPPSQAGVAYTDVPPALLVDLASWRWLFVPPIALVLVAFAMTLHAVPDLARRDEQGFDVIGSLASIVAVAGTTSCSTKAPIEDGLRR